jgi:hypothetical protein
MRILFIFLIVFIIYKLQGIMYIENCMKNLSVHMYFKLIGIFEGEKTEFVEVFYNKKLLPLWWVGANFKISRHINFKDDQRDNEAKDNYRKELLFLNAYERVTKKVEITGSKRGYYTVEQLELNSGDLFGLHKAIRTYSSDAELYVYPKLISTMELDILYKKMSGEIITKRHILEDPFQLRGIREYQPYDSLKQVNWKATAKSGQLMVNQYNFSASQEVIIFVNVEKFNAWDRERLIEESISLAASLAARHIKDGMKVELIANGGDSVNGEMVRVPSGTGLQHNIEVYQKLSRLNINTLKVPITHLLEEKSVSANKEPIFILISHYFDDLLVNKVRELKETGFEIRWLLPKASDTNIEINVEDLYIWDVNDL